MALFKCKMCGGDLEVTADSSIVECEYCGTSQTVPSGDDEKKTNLFNRANRLRMASEFDKASGVYESIVAEFPEEPEAYWGLCLCKYGIEYVDDPATAKKIPTCHRASYESIFEDSNFELALEYADTVAIRLYREEAKEIDRLQKAILEIAAKEEPFDIFICYKETAEDGQRTKDSVLAQDMYDALTAKGYKVFFARITLEDKLGREYEPYIFSALNSAKVMLAVGTKYEYYNAVWVKNEWSRFLYLMKKDKEKMLIPCYCYIDAYDMPSEFKNLQGQDMSKIGFMQDLVRGIGKIIPLKTETTVQQGTTIIQSSGNADTLLKRAYMFLEDKHWNDAATYCDKVLDINPECSKAYLYKVLSYLHICRIEDIDNITVDLKKYSEYNRALQFANSDEKIILEAIRERAEKKVAILHFADVVRKIIKNKKDVVYNSDYTILYSCQFEKNKTTFVIPDSVREIKEGAFRNCNHLEKIVIPDGVEIIGKEAFMSCSSLVSINIPNTVTHIGDGAFSFCNKLTSITMPEGITSIGNSVFLYCKKLASITIPEGVTSIGDNAFVGCESLTSIVIPEGVTSIGDSAFSDCNHLYTLNLPYHFAKEGSLEKYGIHRRIEIVCPDAIKEQQRQEEEERRRKEEESRHREEERRRQLQQEKEERRREEEKREEERRLRKIRDGYRSQGLCQHCGGTFKGLFAKTCTSCNKKKDY